MIFFYLFLEKDGLKELLYWGGVVFTLIGLPRPAPLRSAQNRLGEVCAVEVAPGLIDRSIDCLALSGSLVLYTT